MLSSLHRRFNVCFCYDESRLAKTYLAATYVDYRYRHILNVDESNVAKEYLKSLCPIPTYTVSIANETSGSNANVIVVSAASNINDSADDCTAASLLSAFDEQLTRTNEPNNAILAHPIIADFELYEQYPKPLNKKPTSFEFWNELQSGGRALILSKVALDILSIPASSASVERLFSAAGRAKNAVRSRLGSDALEQECVIRLNRFVLDH